ncbi:AAA family ATPase [Nitratifractor salsuginis]|uniref:ATP-binding protein n=1 Tax=Nitratifractor salsuginis (strain DSM 16511 / JCM 12458 / E9I37-1) TaxID=749222 RepID=E6X3G3_NITSE|nr:ATP-binding protein [Nitratifractor salsuginis]ADV46240.1 ATP-binding protein [Nitratifractor salsuginis DSM 16511]
MICELGLENFTIFRGRHRIGFVPGLNVVIGENGSGKSHLLKLAYTLATAGTRSRFADTDLSERIADRLMAVFRPDILGHLVGWRESERPCHITVSFDQESFSLSFTAKSRHRLSLDRVPRSLPETVPLFLPTAEVLTGYQGFLDLAERKERAFDATYYDLAAAIDHPPTEAVDEKMSGLQRRIEGMIGGTVHREQERFYLHSPRYGKREMTLAGEGVAKLATIARLIQNGTLRPGSLLFWDEPETNLNPKLLRQVADILMSLALQGVQVLLSTHSLFLLREIEILSHRKSFAKLPSHYIALGYDAKHRLTLQESDSLEKVTPLVTLDEALSQADRYLELE